MANEIKENDGPTKSEIDDAVELVVRWTTTGATEAEILEAVSVKLPRMNGRKLMAALAARLKNEGNPNPDAVRGWAILCYRELYRKTMEIGDYDGARKMIKEITALVE